MKDFLEHVYNETRRLKGFKGNKIDMTIEQ